MADALTGIVGSVSGFIGSGMAGDAEKKGLEQASRLVKQQQQATESRFSPYAQAGSEAVGQYAQSVLGGDMSQFYDSPYYDYAVEQGLENIQGTAAAQGSLMSGSTLKALQGYGQKQATFNFENYLNRLQGLSNMGVGVEGNIAGLGASAAGQQGQYAQQFGQAGANQILAQTGQVQQGISSAGSFF